MNDHDFNQLPGQIAGLADAYLRLVALLEMQGVIDGQTLCGLLAQRADSFPAVPCRQAAQETLCFLAGQLDEARNLRPMAAHPAESP